MGSSQVKEVQAGYKFASDNVERKVPLYNRSIFETKLLP